MANYQSTHTGLQIDQAVSAVQTAQTNGGIATVNQLSSYATTTVVNNKVAALYPVGSIYVMSTNSNPGSFLGGTWSIVDKQFKETSVAEFTPTLNTTNCTTAKVSGRVRGHVIQINFSFTYKVEADDDTINLFTITPGNFGVSGFISQEMTHFSDGGQVVIALDMTSAGLVRHNDYLSRSGNKIAAGTSISRMTTTLFVTQSSMLDSWCDRFFFKRTA